jgi:alpha-1,6-mannosyltransferase
MGPLILAGAALAMAAAFSAMAWVGDLYAAARQFIMLFALATTAYGLAAAWTVHRPPAGPRALGAILAAGLAFRLLLLPTVPTLSTDLYRYLWDGRLGAAGVSPYRDPPNAPALADFRDATVYPRLNHIDWRTIYPPGAQLVFTAMARVAPSNVLGMKCLVLAADLLTMGLLLGWLRALGRPLAWVLIYAWHPLVVVELSGSGHLDALALAATVGALWAATGGRAIAAAALVGAGALVKLYPLLLLPAVWGRRPWRGLAASGAVVVAGYAVYWRDGVAVLGSLGRYVAEEQFNGGARAGLELVLAPLGPAGLLAARVVPLLGLAGLAVAVARWAAPAERRARWLVGGYLVATPNLFPWYALWMVPLLAVAPAWPWLYLTGAVAFTYAIFAEPVWSIPAWALAAQWIPFVLGLAWFARPPGAAPGGALWRPSA